MGRKALKEELESIDGKRYVPPGAAMIKAVLRTELRGKNSVKHKSYLSKHY
jgi:hypothetical protein